METQNPTLARNSNSRFPPLFSAQIPNIIACEQAPGEGEKKFRRARDRRILRAKRLFAGYEYHGEKKPNHASRQTQDKGIR